MDAKKKEREALLKAKEFAGEIATFGGKHSYLNGTEVVRDAYKLLGTIEAALSQPAQGGCDAGAMCLGCQPRAENGGCPDAQPPADTIAVPRSEWISVSERMPDKACLAFYTNKLGNPRIVKAKYTPRFTHEAHGDCTDEWCEYSEEHDEYFYPEGWYECIDNWDDYAFVTINDATVTHWMPLPEYPAKSTGEDV